MPITRGATPAVAMPTMRARGVRPWRVAAASLASSSAQLPSLTPLALPAVTVPSGRTMPLSLASASRLVARGCSSCRTTSASPFFCAIVTGQISASKKPRCCAASVFCWLASAMRSCASRSMRYSAATFSAVSGIESMPYCALSSGFTKRQPMVVS